MRNKLNTMTRVAMACSGLCLSATLATGAVHAVGVAPTESPFAGSWSGTFINLDTGEGGTLEWTIADNGRLVGSFLWDDGASGDLVGMVRPNGKMRVAAPGGGGAYHGEASIGGGGGMIVLATDVDNGATYSIELGPV